MNKYLAYGVGLLVLLTATYLFGYSSGSQNVQSKWDRDKIAVQEQALNQITRYIKLHKEFSSFVDSSRETLRKKESEYAQNMADITLFYADSLRDSEDRAEYYRRITANGGSTCRSLADHAGRLDKSLVEGQRVVRELINALERRNVHVRFVGGILIQEQNLIIGE